MYARLRYHKLDYGEKDYILSWNVSPLTEEQMLLMLI